jgi:NADH-quinone oxidoreductase subunit K
VTVVVAPEQGLMLASAIFAIGVVGLLMRRNVLFMLMSLEIMLNAAGFALVAAGSRWGQADGQVMFLFVLTIAASEVAVGLGLIVLLNQRQKSLDADLASRMRG